jgi:RNA polymerase sigma-70 factor (ECF subfamily)
VQVKGSLGGIFMSVQLECTRVSVSCVPAPISKSSTDTELVIACQKGDAKAFDLLMKRHRRTVYAMLHRLAPDWASHHDDFAQEAMIRLYRGIKSMRNPNAFKAWLNQTVTNLFYDELRRKPKVVITSIESAYANDEGHEASGMEIADVNNQPDELFERKEIVREVNEAINQLPDNYKQAIVLREFHGLAYEEIARLTNSEVGTVKSRLSRARNKVQVLLQPSLCA